MTVPLHDLSIAQAGERLRSGAITSRQLTEHALSRIDALDDRIHAFITVTRERALSDASVADQDFANGVDRGPMQGIPFALKDIYDTAGILTTCHSKLREHNVPGRDSAVAEKFAAQGAVLLGKLSTHEFALGGPSFDLPWPPARNPWNQDHITGGSSSGSGAAVSAGIVRMAMGSDTGGSIRGPAAYCGVVGIKPTFGLVSRRGVFPLSHSLDHCGPLAWTVEDAAIALDVVAGYDPRDPSSAERAKPDFLAGLGRGVEGLRIAVPRHFFAQDPDLSVETAAAMDAALSKLEALGAVVEDVRLPDYELFAACGRIIMFSEAFSIHENDFRTRALDFGKLTYMRMGLGAFITASDLTQAHRLRRQLTQSVNATLRNYDGIVTASALSTAPRFIEAGPRNPAASPLQSMSFNVTGNPAMSMPIGLASNGLPMSIQIVGKPFDEAMVFRIGAALESQIRHDLRRPPL